MVEPETQRNHDHKWRSDQADTDAEKGQNGIVTFDPRPGEFP